MRTGRSKAALVVTPEERQELESLAHRSRSAPALARRARVVLACAAGRDNTSVARRLRTRFHVHFTSRGYINKMNNVLPDLPPQKF